MEGMVKKGQVGRFLPNEKDITVVLQLIHTSKLPQFTEENKRYPVGAIVHMYFQISKKIGCCQDFILPFDSCLP